MTGPPTGLQIQIGRIRSDRFLRLTIYGSAIGIMYAAGLSLPVIACAIASVIIDFLAIIPESSLLRKRSFKVYLLLCATYSLEMSLSTVPVIAFMREGHLAAILIGYAALWSFAIHCLLVRADKVLIAVFSGVPVAVSIVLTTFDLLDRVRADMRIFMIISAVFILIYLTLSVHEAIHQKQQLVRARRREYIAHRARDRFFAAVGHELRTPLNGILGIAQILESEAVTREEKDLAETLMESSEVLKALLDDLLDHSKLAAGQFTISPQAVQPAQLCESVTDLYGAAARNKRLQLDLDIAADVPEWIMTDPVRLRQIISNLLGNALKHTSSGSVRLLVDRDDTDSAAMLRMRVVDEGAGIPKERIDQLFTPFVQLEDEASRAGLGTGLGLSIARDLARLLGGDISVDSLHGVGSTFTVRLPLVEAEAPGAAGPVDEKSIPDTGAEVATGRVFVVADDNRINRMIAGKLLNRLGATVLEAESSEEAIAICRQRAVDVVVTDMNMPGMNGRDTLATLRADPDLAEMIVILLSAVDDDTGRDFDAVLTKPLDRAELVSTLTRLLPERGQAAA